MVLLSVSDTARAVTFGPMENKGNLIYKFVNAGVNVPIIMQNLEDPVPKVIIHELPMMVTHKNVQILPEKCSKIGIKLYYLFLFTGY